MLKFTIFVATTFLVGNVVAFESLETILSRCCNIGLRRGWENNTCNGFPGAVPNVKPEHQTPCLATIDACCQRNNRDRMCLMGHEAAKSGKDCTEITANGGSHYRDCCEGCKLGLTLGSMGLICDLQSLKMGLGPPWDTSVTKCCLQAGGQSSTPHKQSPRSTLPTTAGRELSSTGENFCDLFHGKLCSQICISNGDSFTCTCYEGYKLLQDQKTCILNSPQSSPFAGSQDLTTSSGTDHFNSERTTVGATDCPVGFTFNLEMQICDDINECEVEKGTACRKFPYKRCVNTVGSFLCEQMPRDNERNLLCPPGYRFSEEASTCLDINECEEDLHICDLTIQYCINTPGGFDCQGKNEFTRYTCPAGFKFNNHTLNCEDVDECRENLASCGEYEVCRNTAGAYDCDVRCQDGYRFDIRLRSCQDENECVEGTHDCMIEKEICVNIPGSYQCHQIQAPRSDCPAGFEPNPNYTFLCQDVDECNTPLLHNCGLNEVCVNEIGGFHCELSSPEPTQTLLVADSMPAESDGEIQDNTIPNSTGELQPNSVRIPADSSLTEKPVILCKAGFRFEHSGDNGACEDIDECRELRNPCDSSQLCQNTIGSFYCHCRSGFYRDPVTKTCQDVNECQTGQHTCSPSQRCDNSPGSYSCIRITGCGTGYTLNSGTGQCEDDDECIFGNHNCNALGPEWLCKNTLGSFRCERVQKTCPNGLSLAPNGECRPTCPSGYHFTSRGECIDVDECRQVQGSHSACAPHQRCVNTEGSFQCLSKIICPRGYEPEPTGTRCTDVDECKTGQHTCKGTQECINRAGGYVCQCPTGYTLIHNGACEDINECTRFGGHVCSSNSDCYNTQGSFRCICKSGFEQGRDNHTCNDIDECASGDKHRLCDQNCINTWGSFKCACNSGFTLAADGRTCQDMDECSLSHGGGAYLCSGTCVNTHGSYRCSCPEGYRIGTDRRICHDMDECERSPCRSDENCLNTRGGFRCNRLSCPRGYQKEGDQTDRCKRNTQCTSVDSECLKQPLTISRNYLSFTSNVRLGTMGYVDMFTMKGPSWPGAVMHFTLELKSTRAPSGVAPVTRDYFLLRRPTSYQAVISLTKPIVGPQDVELELLMEVYHRGSYAGSALAQIVLVITAYEY